MNSAFNQLVELVWGAIALKPTAFQAIIALPQGGAIALGIVLIAGFSQGIAQSIILFVNRVRLLRFILSLIIAAILFAFGYGFWAISTWFAYHLIIFDQTSFATVWKTLGLAYAPNILSIFIALPYLGVPISVGLSVWSFLAFLVGLTTVFQITLWSAFFCGIVGWIVFQILQRTIGRPIAALGRWIKNTVAGVNLITDLKELEQIVGQRTRQKGKSS